MIDITGDPLSICYARILIPAQHRMRCQSCSYCRTHTRKSTDAAPLPCEGILDTEYHRVAPDDLPAAPPHLEKRPAATKLIFSYIAEHGPTSIDTFVLETGLSESYLRDVINSYVRAGKLYSILAHGQSNRRVYSLTPLREEDIPSRKAELDRIARIVALTRELGSPTKAARMLGIHPSVAGKLYARYKGEYPSADGSTQPAGKDA